MITERQYEELRTYESGHPSWQRGGISGTTARLIDKGLLRKTAAAGFCQITPAGVAALHAVRQHYGLPVGA